MISRYADRDRFVIGTLSHILNQEAHGYHKLDEFPEEAPDPTVRNVEVKRILYLAQHDAGVDDGLTCGYFSQDTSYLAEKEREAATIAAKVLSFPTA